MVQYHPKQATYPQVTTWKPRNYCTTVHHGSGGHLVGGCSIVSGELMPGQRSGAFAMARNKRHTIESRRGLNPWALRALECFVRYRYSCELLRISAQLVHHGQEIHFIL
jgi:hypothetical protein